MLNDSGSKSSMAGAGMRLLENSVMDHEVDAIGAIDGADIAGLSIGIYIAECITNHYDRVLTMWPQLVGYRKGKDFGELWMFYYC